MVGNHRDLFPMQDKIQWMCFTTGDSSRECSACVEQGVSVEMCDLLLMMPFWDGYLRFWISHHPAQLRYH